MGRVMRSLAVAIWACRFRCDATRACRDANYAVGKELGIQVLGAGQARTGTLSLMHALSILGYATSHGYEDVVRSWEAYKVWRCGNWTAKREWLRHKHFTALADKPYYHYLPELLDDNPHMKVVLTVHPGGAEAWKRSMAKFEAYLDVSEYVEWNRNVTEIVPKGQLLRFNVSEGWMPLVKFLGLQVPAAPFPNTGSHVDGIYAEEVRFATEMATRLYRTGCPGGTGLDDRWGKKLTEEEITHLNRMNIKRHGEAKPL